MDILEQIDEEFDSEESVVCESTTRRLSDEEPDNWLDRLLGRWGDRMVPINN